jgi:phenylpyruvate tautomerase PptA (4-oxalocrotonate tautomerase family)
MPLVRISLLKGKPAAHVRAIADSVHRALVDVYSVPADDRFQLIHQHEADEIIFDADYLGVHRTSDVVFIHITAINWRDTATKQGLYRRLVQLLADDPGLRPDDVQVILSPNGRDDWYFGKALAASVEAGIPGLSASHRSSPAA